ncbi:hypothetical protein COV18_02545 [Candidatus Woesearchaeota archaeon CG10_big_fil_rev_8_21_14_0_10_37_12]|nr:MAG: hypothetical protein COV18_02545 [Candidatus Woesearchaeota archaeon CG10_big_fil_rev_8_21_14_0_10_37_12]
MATKYFFATLLLFLLACQPALQAVPSSAYQNQNQPEETNPCAAVSCLAGQICENGECICSKGTKMCDGQCIAEHICCDNNDCNSEDFCNNGTCEPVSCEYGQQAKDGECVCAENMKYCSEQRKCISKESCCVFSMCSEYDRCVETLWRTHLCFELPNKTTCKAVGDNDQTVLFSLEGEDFRVSTKRWYSDERIMFSINNEDITIPTHAKIPYNQTELQDLSLYHEGIIVLGGFCKPDETD